MHFQVRFLQGLVFAFSALKMALMLLKNFAVIAEEPTNVTLDCSKVDCSYMLIKVEESRKI